MSNFYCEKCGKAILEGSGGHYVTECKHYPLEFKTKEEKKMKELFETEFYVAGVKFRPDWKANLESLEIGEELILEPEPTNKFDKNAIKILSKHGDNVCFHGYVPAKTGEALVLTQYLNEGMILKATVKDLAPDFEPWQALLVKVEEVKDA